MDYCFHELSTSETERPQDQMVAICMEQWRSKKGLPAPAESEVARIIAHWLKILKADAPEPHKGESYDSFKNRCIKETDEHACETAWNEWVRGQEAKPGKWDPHSEHSLKQGNGCPEVGDDEMHEDYMDRCTEDNDEDECQLKWEESRSVHGGIVHKTHAEAVQGMDFILSDDTPDRMGDVISSDGWDFKSFASNPIALFNHNPNFPIGRWKDLRVDKNALKGRLVMAPEGTSNRIDEIRKLIDAGILKAVSVGFRDIESEPLEKKNPYSGRRFIKQELVETSLVAIPANPNALAVVKSLGISPQTLDLVFVKHDKRDQVKRREFTGKHADTSRKERRAMTMPLSERISNVQALIVESKDALSEHWDHADQTNVSDADMQKAQDLNTTIASLERQHAALVESERILSKGASNGNGSTGSRSLTVFNSSQPQPEPRASFTSTAPAIADVKKEADAVEYLVRAATVGTFAKLWGKSPEETRLKIAETRPQYGGDDTKASCELVLRAPSAPAMTTVAGWAAELVQTRWESLMPLLLAQSILPRLAAKGLSLSFGTTGRIIIPTRQRTPSLAGSFVGEGLAIPVRQGAFTSQTLVPKKMAVISTWTREMSDHSTPAIEGLIREAIQQDTSIAIDTVLIDANPATVIRPAGLLNGVTGLTATAGGGLAALIGDIKQLITALVTSTYGNLRSPVFLMNPGDVLSASLASAVNTGIFPFRDEVRAGTLNTVPIIDSATVPSKTVILIDAADFVIVGGEAPRLELSDQATLHMEDTAPTELVGTGTPGTVASPQRSLFQTDSIALRMVLPLNWVQRRTGTVAWTSAVTWS
jgi:HK97 family phage prohead protease/HK97 family phage major capsid protein